MKWIEIRGPDCLPGSASYPNFIWEWVLVGSEYGGSRMFSIACYVKGEWRFFRAGYDGSTESIVAPYCAGDLARSQAHPSVRNITHWMPILPIEEGILDE